MAKKEISGVYKITNLKNGKIYIGGSRDIICRLNAHKSFLKQRKHSTIPNDEYCDINDFEFDILEITKIDKINEKELYYINLYNTCNPDRGYNKINSAQTGIATKRNLSEITSLNLKINVEICRDIKIIAAQNRKYISDIAEEALKEYLEKHKAVK